MQGSEYAQRARAAADAADADVRDYETAPTRNPVAGVVAIAHASSTGKGLLIAFSNGVEAFLEAEVLLRLIESGEGVILSGESTGPEPDGPRLLPDAEELGTREDVHAEGDKLPERSLLPDAGR